MHEPPKYVIKAIKKINEYCDNNGCELCPYKYNGFKKDGSCLFMDAPPFSSTWKNWVTDMEVAKDASE